MYYFSSEIPCVETPKGLCAIFRVVRILEVCISEQQIRTQWIRVLSNQVLTFQVALSDAPSSSTWPSFEISLGLVSARNPTSRGLDDKNRLLLLYLPPGTNKFALVGIKQEMPQDLLLQLELEEGEQGNGPLSCCYLSRFLNPQHHLVAWPFQAFIIDWPSTGVVNFWTSHRYG